MYKSKDKVKNYHFQFRLGHSHSLAWNGHVQGRSEKFSNKTAKCFATTIGGGLTAKPPKCRVKFAIFTKKPVFLIRSSTTNVGLHVKQPTDTVAVGKSCNFYAVAANAKIHINRFIFIFYSM